MFITLKSSSKQGGDTGMEEVASRNAAKSNASAGRARWRHPCIACQSKQLRCTGRARDCDRCVSRSQACIYPAFQLGPRNNRRQVRAQMQHRSSSNDSSGSDTQVSPSDGVSSQSSPQTPPGVGEPMIAVAAATSSDDGFGDLVNFAQISAEMETLAQHKNMAPVADVGAEFLPGTTQHHTYLTDNDSTSDFLRLSPNQPSKSPSESLQIPADTGIPLLGLDGVFLPWMLQELEANPSLSTQQRPPCSCLEDVIRTVQQLEDDSFHLRTLPLDRVLQLQKYMTTQCRTAIKCPSCDQIPTVRTMVVIICDRLTEMFECIHRRLQGVNQRISEQSMPSLPPGVFTAPIQDDNPLPGQLFCGITGGETAKMSCNPMLFQEQLHAMYSDEEQVHMISALLRLQSDSVKELLDRLGGSVDNTGSQAQRSKANALRVRVDKAQSDIDEAFKVSLQVFAGLRN